MFIQSVLITMALFAVTGAVIPVFLPMKEKLHRRSLDCDVMTCLEPIIAILHSESGFDPEEFENEFALNYLCLELYAMEECIRSGVNSCPIRDPMSNVLVDTVDGVVGHICSVDGKDAILTETECWNDKALMAAAEQCENNFNTEFFSGNETNHCGIIDDYLNCTVGAAQSLCSEKAARFVDGLVYYSTEPVARTMFHCDIETRMTRDLMSVLKTFKKL